jgi:hypothetical protein
MRQNENFPNPKSAEVNPWIIAIKNLINLVYKGLLTSSVLDIQTSRFLNVAREEIPETQNCEVIYYLVFDLSLN